MTNKTITFFMTTSEFSILLKEIVDTLGLWVITFRLGSNRHFEVPSEPGKLLMADMNPADWVFIANEKPDLIHFDPVIPNPAKWGWLHCDVPRESDNSLSLSELSAKSDWYEKAVTKILENRASLRLFNQVKPHFVKRLTYPIWISGRDKTKVRADRSLGYSQGVVNWVRSGGILIQKGVPNTYFSISDPQK
ncbi:MAG: hypothetical protein ACYDBJ_14435 [Aggregatilineales bacterium]